MQGKAWNKEEVVELLKPKFQLGYSFNKACELINLPPSTFKTWLETDEELRLKVNAWQNEISDLARTIWLGSIKEGIPTKYGPDQYTPAKEWLERKEKKEFSTRQEVTGEDGTPLIPEEPLTIEQAKKVYEIINGQEGTTEKSM